MYIPQLYRLYTSVNTHTHTLDMAAVRFIMYLPQLYSLYTSVHTHWIWQLSGSLCIYYSYTVCIQVFTHTGYGSCQVHYVFTTAILFVYKRSHTLDMAAVRFITYIPQLYSLYTSVYTHWIWQLSGSLCIYHSYTVCIQVFTHTLDMAAVRFIMYLPQLYSLYTSVHTHTGYGSCQVHYVYTTAIQFVYKCSHTLDMAAVRFIMYLPQLYCLYTSVHTHWIWQLSGSLCIYHSYTVCIQVFTHTGYGSCQVHYVYTTAIQFVYKCSHTLDMAAVRFIMYLPQLYCLYTSVNTHWIWQLSGSLCIYHSYTVCIQVLTHTGYGSCQAHYVYKKAIQFVYKCSHTLDMAAVRFIMYLPQLYCLYTSVNTHWIWQLSGSLCIYHSYTVCIQVLTHTGYGSCQVHYVYTTAIQFVYKCSHTLDMAAVRFITYIPQLYSLYTSVNTHWIWQLSGSLCIYHSYTVCIQVLTHTGYGSCQVHYVYTTAILFVYKC